MRHGPAGRRLRNNRGGSNNGGGGGHNNNPRRSNGGGGNGGGGYSNNRNHVYDSNGPEVRIRGTAHQIQEKYTTLAKDAASSGDTVLSESYLQHAEHYQRIINSWAESNPPQRYNDDEDGNNNYGETRQPDIEPVAVIHPSALAAMPQPEAVGEFQS